MIFELQAHSQGILGGSRKNTLTRAGKRKAVGFGRDIWGLVVPGGVMTWRDVAWRLYPLAELVRANQTVLLGLWVDRALLEITVAQTQRAGP